MDASKSIKVFQKRTNRGNEEFRNVKITPNYLLSAEGSVLIEMGNTKVICAVTIQDGVPQFLKGQSQGWLTAEYSMLPRATEQRNQREAVKGKQTGRTMEIQRLIGRSLRCAVDLAKLGEKTITIDCDVIQADGGTRTASITGSYVALALAVNKLMKVKRLNDNPIKGNVAAISVGKVHSDILLDLEFIEDSIAEVDMNVVINHKGEFIEVQGTGEEATFNRDTLNKMLDYAASGVQRLIEIQNKAIEEGLLNG